MRLIIIILFVLCAFWQSGCKGNKSDKNEKHTNNIYPVTSVVVRDTLLYSEYVTDIHAVRNIEIRARVGGFLNKIYVDEGQEVKKGQPLFSINDEEYRAELAKAKAFLNTAIAEAKAAQLEVDKVRLLVEKKVISRTELEVAEAKLIAANSKIEEARSAEANAAIRLSYTHIKAPFDGLIDRIPLKAGSLIDQGSLLTTLSDNHEVYGYFNVSENEYLNYVKTRIHPRDNKNMKVHLVLADGSRYEYPGKIETMEGEFQQNTGSIAFRARFPNPEKLLKHGASGKIVVTRFIKNALIVPQKCVFEIQDKNFVFVLDSMNHVRMQSFIPYTRLSRFYIVQSGLKEQDKVVYEGLQNIREGDRIVPRLLSQDSLLRSDQLMTLAKN